MATMLMKTSSNNITDVAAAAVACQVCMEALHVEPTCQSQYLRPLQLTGTRHVLQSTCLRCHASIWTASFSLADMLFCLCRDQRLYKASLTSKTCDLQPLTAEDSKLRFADAVIDIKRNRLILVCEDHSKEGEAVNTISSVGQTPMCFRHPSCDAFAFQAASVLQFLLQMWWSSLACAKHASSHGSLRPSHMFVRTSLLYK